MSEDVYNLPTHLRSLTMIAKQSCGTPLIIRRRLRVVVGQVTAISDVSDIEDCFVDVYVWDHGSGHANFVKGFWYDDTPVTFQSGLYASSCAILRSKEI